jgi:pyridoxamine 5'-phosphate oxidase
MSISHIRKDYQLASLSESEVKANPIDQFAIWFQQALERDPAEANAMSLATVDGQGRPSCRIVLMKEFDERGISWFTNYDSRKGQELADNPHAALLFFWHGLERQVRIEGTIEQISATENDHYFYSRPVGSRQSACASQQSKHIENREQLEQQLEKVVAEFGEDPPRPIHWGGYRLHPTTLEFWQGRSSRLHDRIVYQKQDDGSWTLHRLQP